MNICVEHNIGDRVCIPELEKVGVVVSIWVQMKGTQYEVRYFDNAEIHICYFFADEIKSTETIKK